MNNYLTTHKELIEKWKHSRPAGTADFVSDGIVHPQTWFGNKEEKILFFLKEAYSTTDEIEWDLTKWLYHEDGEVCANGCNKQCSSCWPSGRTYNHVAEQAYMILNPTNSFDAWLGVSAKTRINYLQARRDVLKKVAVVNIKKYGGKSASSNSDLMDNLKKDLLKEQISIICPTVIVCGGTYPFLKEIMGLPEMVDPYDGGTIYKGIKIIAAYHPNKRISSKEKAERVFEQYQLLRGNG